jgi:hypothetical protein
MDKTKSSAKPTDLVKGSTPKTTPELTEAELAKASGGTPILFNACATGKHILKAQL